MLAGYAVVAVEDGIDALRRVEGDPPSLVVLDIGLPRLSGLDVQQELAAHDDTRDIPIVVVTGDTSELNADDFDCILKKPVTEEALIDAVKNCLERTRRSHKAPDAPVSFPWSPMSFRRDQ